MLKISYPASSLHSLHLPWNSHFTFLSGYYTPRSNSLLEPQFTSWPHGVWLWLLGTVPPKHSSCSIHGNYPMSSGNIPCPLHVLSPPRLFTPRFPRRTQSKILLASVALPTSRVLYNALCHPRTPFPKCHTCNWLNIMQQAVTTIQPTSAYKTEPDGPPLGYQLWRSPTCKVK